MDNQRNQFRTLSVLIPCFNERDTLEAIVQRVRADDTGLQTEIVAVDDGSTDGSREILDCA